MGKRLTQKNQKHFKALLSFAKKIMFLCKEHRIPFVIYGSFAHFFHTKDLAMRINDIDIIVRTKDLKRLRRVLETSGIKCKAFPDGSLIVRKGKLIVEMDCLGEGYPSLNETNLLKSTRKIDFYGLKANIITIRQLEEIYVIAYSRSKDDKAKIEKRIKHLEAFLGRKLKNPKELS